MIDERDLAPMPILQPYRPPQRSLSEPSEDRFGTRISWRTFSDIHQPGDPHNEKYLRVASEHVKARRKVKKESSGAELSQSAAPAGVASSNVGASEPLQQHAGPSVGASEPLQQHAAPVVVASSNVETSAAGASPQLPPRPRWAASTWNPAISQQPPHTLEELEVAVSGEAGAEPSADNGPPTLVCLHTAPLTPGAGTQAGDSDSPEVGPPVATRAVLPDVDIATPIPRQPKRRLGSTSSVGSDATPRRSKRKLGPTSSVGSDAAPSHVKFASGVLIAPPLESPPPTESPFTRSSEPSSPQTIAIGSEWGVSPGQVLQELLQFDVQEGHDNEFMKEIMEVRNEAEAPDDEKINKLKKLAETGEFENRSAAWQVFNRQHKPGTNLHEVYHALDKDGKAEHKRNWAKTHFGNELKEKTFKSAYKAVDTTLGEYLTFGATVIKFGGWSWKPAIVGAMNLFGRCARMGGTWSKIDKFSGLPVSFVLTQKHEETLDRSWELCIKEWQTTGAATVDPTAPGKKTLTGTKPAEDVPSNKRGLPAGDRVEPAGKRAVRAGKAPGGGGQRSGASGGTAADKVAKKLNELLKDAATVKKDYARIIMLTTNTLECVKKKEPGYAWAENPENHGHLTLLLEEVTGQVSKVGKDVLLLDTSALKKKYGKAELTSELENFKLLTPKLKQLEKSVTQLLRRCEC